MRSSLVFVYNADSGLFSGLSALAHRVFSPDTYACRLCLLTHSTLGMRRAWRQFVAELPSGTEFIHADAFRARYGIEAALPAIYRRDGEGLRPWIAADDLNRCESLEELQTLIRGRLNGLHHTEQAAVPENH